MVNHARPRKLDDAGLRQATLYECGDAIPGSAATRPRREPNRYLSPDNDDRGKLARPPNRIALRRLRRGAVRLRERTANWPEQRCADARRVRYFVGDSL